MTAILALLDFIPRWVFAALLAASLAHGCWNGHQRDVARTALKTEKADRAIETATREKTAREATDEARRIESKRQSAAQEIAVATAAEKSSVRLALASATVDLGKLRNEVELYASGSGRAACDSSTLPGPDRRAVVLGQLLATCREEASGDAGDLESLATQVRGLLRSYRSLTSDPPSPPR